MSTQVNQLDEDDGLDATSDYTEEYERYLSNLENSYDICISIDFIADRLVLAQKSIKNNFEDNIIDSAHCYHLLSTVLPKSVEFLCKTDLNNLYDQDIIQYQKINRQTYTTNTNECREFLVNKIEQYFEFVIQFILTHKPNYQKEFYDVLKDIFMLTHRIYKPHTGWIDRLSQEYREEIMDECSGKYAECSSTSLKQYHPNYIKLINYFGAQSGFTIILQEMLDGKKNKKKSHKNDNHDSEGVDNKENNPEIVDKPPSTLTHHALQCYIISLACIHRFLVHQIKQSIAEYMFQAVEHWYMSMSIKSLKQYPRSQVHAILRKLYYLITNQNKREDYVKKFEYLRLEIAYRWLCTDSLERKITAWKEFKEYIETTQRKYDIINNPHKYTNQQLSTHSYCKNPKAVSIWYINCRDVANFLHRKNVLNLFLAEDVHEELLKKSFDILYFLGWYHLLDVKYILMLWNHSIEKTESFVNTVYKVMIDLFQCLTWELIEYILDLIIDIHIDTYNNAILELISSFCSKCLYRSQLKNTIAVPQKIAEWHCGLKLLWRAMQSERAHNECSVSLANQDIQQLAMNKLVYCLQSDSGAVHQEYCKNLCVENLRCSRSVGTSTRVLQNIINAHPIIPPPPPPNTTQTNTMNQSFTSDTKVNTPDDNLTGDRPLIKAETQHIEETKDDDTKENKENKENEDTTQTPQHSPTGSGSYFGRESTRSEIIHSLEQHHGILNLFFQDLSRYMSAYNPHVQEHKTEGDSSTAQPRQIVNFRARFDFLRFILQYSSLRLASKQLDDLWNIVIGDTLKSDYSIPYTYKLEQNYFFKWLKDICPPLGSHGNNNANSPAISVDDAVNLFHAKLGSMPRKTMTSDSLQCLHQYFDLVYELATKKSATSGVTAHPDLSAALDVMWEIAIEAETDTVAQSCGVFILSFYMKPAVHQNHIQTNTQTQTQTTNIQNKVSDNILNLINNAAANTTNTTTTTATTTTTGTTTQPPQAVVINKWEGRTNFVEKCMDYIQQQSISSNFRAVHRCLDLLETFIECTRPGVMRGEIHSDNGTNNDLNGFGDESSSDSVIYMGNNSKKSGIGTTGLSANDFKKTSPWDLGRYALKYWKLPIGLNHFIKINISNLQMQKDTKNFQIMINKYSRVGELQDLIAAILNQDKGLLQMQANNNVSLTPQIEANTLESCNLRDGCTITVMSIFSLQNDQNSNLLVPDGAFILSQNRFYIELLLELLNKRGNNGNLFSRLWNLLMRLPFNLQVLASLKDIVGYIQSDENNNKVITTNVNWNLFIDASSTFKLLYSLQVFDSVMQHCNSSWLDSFMMLNGLQHLYYTLINFEFDYTDNVFTYASYRALYMLFKIFSSLTSHELIESDPLYTRCKPRHNTPKIIKIRSVNGTLSKFNHNELDILKLGTKIFELILEILKQIEKNESHNHSGGNPLLAEIVELALYQFIALLFFYSSRLTPLFDERYQQQSLQNDVKSSNVNWIHLLSSSLFCSDKLIRKCVVKHLYQIFVKYNPEASASQNLHHKTLELLYRELETCKLNYSRHFMCLEYFEFYGYVIKHYCKNVLYFDPTSYNQSLRYFEGAPLQYAWTALKSYRGLETRHSDRTDEYLLGLLKLLCSIIVGFPTLKQHCTKLMRELKNELIQQCLFAVPDPFENPLGILTAPKRPPIPKCMTSASRQAAFSLLLEISKNNAPLWNEILMDLQEIHDKRMNDIGDDIGFGFNPEYSRRACVGLCGLNNYGCTCYMNATMQQLYCNPVVRKVILGVDLRKLYPQRSDDENIPSLKKTVFYAMQTMFSNLQWSDKRAAWPEDFLQNYRDFEGNKIDPNEQMDAHEFFNFLFDNLERELKGTIAEQILKNEFCGKEVNQVICQECGYVSETFVPMYAVSCKIQNHQTLEESLEYEFVRGDWLKGGNAYRCGKCNKKVTALKRSCFTQLSNTMLVHLQRFEFNLETMLKVKINSELRFPINLNMKKYTKEYLDFQENKCSTDTLMDDSDYEYELVGITVHSGMADIGHYYSFIRKQDNNGTLGSWYSFNDDYVSNFDTNTMQDKCFGGNKLTLIRDAKTNQLVQRWIAKSNNAYILVYRRKNIDKKVENMGIQDAYLTLKDFKLTELKANNGKPPKVNIIQQTNNPAIEEIDETVTEKQTEHEHEPDVDDEAEQEVVNKESATESSNSPQIMETAKDGEISHIQNEDTIQPEPIIEEPEEDTSQPCDADVVPANAASLSATGVNINIENVDNINEENNMQIGHSLELEDEELNELFDDEDIDDEENKTDVQHHLYDIAETVHWNNTRFTKKCQLCDINFVDFQWRFFNLEHNKYSHILPINRYKCDKIRRNIGSARTKLILYFIWDILCKFESATKIPSDDGNSNRNNQSKKERHQQLKKLTAMYSWCEFLKKLFKNDIESSYQFVYLLTHTHKRMWCKYLLECKNVLVRECLVDVMIFAVKCLLTIERPLYYFKEQDEDDHDEDKDNDEYKYTSDERIEINRNKKDEFVAWFQSASVIVHLLDEMCRNILLATNYWRRFNEFWLFFKLFAELGNEEKQLLLDRHLIIECYRFYNNKKPYEYGLKQLIKEEDDDLDMDGDYLLPYKVKYDRRKMGSADCEPDVSFMIHMLSLIICSCCPPNLKGIKRINKLTDVILPYNTMELSVCCKLNKFNILSICDKRLLNDAKIWMKFLEDNQNTNCLSNIICHLSWKNIDFSKKICKQFVVYLEEYHDNVYQSCFNVTKSLLQINDYIEEKDDENDTLSLKIFAHARIDRFLTPTIKMIRDWYRDNKYMQSVAKIAQFIDECNQNNIQVANYFRIKSKDVNIQWFQQFLNSHSYYLNLPRPPEFN